jgi:hypothetical protein
MQLAKPVPPNSNNDIFWGVATASAIVALLNYGQGEMYQLGPRPGNTGSGPQYALAPVSSTSLQVNKKLDKLATEHPSMASQVHDARKFASLLPPSISTPRIWTDGETEVTFEWNRGHQQAVVSFEGDGQFGYAMKQGRKFVPGSSPNEIGAAALDDLIEYLI